jgi:hypothetical protein
MLNAQLINDTDAINDTAKQWALDNLEYLNSNNKLLGSSLKVEKGRDKAYTVVMYLQPADKIATKTLCAGAKFAGCKKECLISSGMLGMTTGQRAATRRTILFLLDRQTFDARLRSEIEREYKKHGDSLAVRLNGTADIDFSAFISSMPHVRFYDYTKVWARVVKNTLANYDLTYSGSAYSDKSIAMTARAVVAGARVAVAFNTGERKGEFKMPKTVADFDTTDLRFLDKPVLGGLKYKGGSIKTRQANAERASFFFTPKTYDQLTNIIARG